MKSMAGADQRQDVASGADGADVASPRVPAAAPADQTVSTTDDPTAAPSPARQLPSPDDPTRTSTGKLPNEPPISLRDRDDRLPAPLQVRDPERYQILNEHGRGGLGRVFRARDKELGRDVAVKELLNRGTTAELRFFREALITARLEHPGIVPVHEAGRWPDGTPFYAMKLVQGRPLKALIDECKTLEERLALLPHVIAVADAIAYAHDRKIIHRDLKPSNVIVGDFGETVVIDWGLAKDLTDAIPDLAENADDGAPYRPAVSAQDGLTVAGTILGTPAYMAPEQARGEPVDERADVYSIGAILHHLVLGTPQPGAIPTDNVDPDLAAILTKATSESAPERYQSAGGLTNDLRAFTAGTRIASRRYSLGQLLGHWYRRHRRVALSVAVVAFAVAAATVVAFRAIVGERDVARRASDRARAALAEARDSERRARLSEAELLIDLDPTRARALLRADDTTTAESAILLARTLAAGVATTTFTLPTTKITDVVPSRSGATLAVATSDRSLFLLSVSAQTQTRIPVRLSQPPLVVPYDDGWMLIRMRGTSHALASLSADGALADLVVAPDAPTSIFSLRTGVGLVLANGDLLTWQSGTTATALTGVRAAGATSDGVIHACMLDGHLVSIVPHHHSTDLRTTGECATTTTRFSFAVRETTVATPVTHSSIRVEVAGRVRMFDSAVGAYDRTAASLDGALAFIDSDGEARYLLPGDDEPRDAPPVGSTPTAVGADGALLAWGFADGTVMIVDGQTQERWQITAHTTDVVHVSLLPFTNSVVTAGDNLVRLWQLSVPAPRPVGQLDCRPFNMRMSHDTKHLAMDCGDGHAHALLDAVAEPRIVPLHHHSQLAFGVAWLGDKVCTTSWDGTIKCSTPANRTSREVLAHSRATRWVEATNTFGAAAAADGKVWTFDENGLRLVHEHDAEPYRLAISPNEERIASVDHEGIAIVSRRDGTDTHVINAHSSLATAVSWYGTDLLFASDDGTVSRWTSQNGRFERAESIPVGVSPRYLKVLDGGFAVAVGDDSLFLRHRNRNHKFTMPNTITALDTSADGTSVAVGTRLGEILIINPSEGYAMAVPSTMSTISCLEHSASGWLFAGTTTGTIFRVRPDHYPRQKLPNLQESSR